MPLSTTQPRLGRRMATLPNSQEASSAGCNIDQHFATHRPYWRDVPIWMGVSEQEFLSHRWQIANTVQGAAKLRSFLQSVLPGTIPGPKDKWNAVTQTREDFVEDVMDGMRLAPMSIRLTPHILSVANWSDPLSDPIRRQFIPLKSTFLPDHPQLVLDSLGEEHDSPVPGLVHRYPDKALFLATSVCPVYCRFCTRSYAVGAPTDAVTKSSQKPTRKRWDVLYRYIESTPALTDIVVSGGDAYYLQPEQITEIGQRLLSIPHIRRIRFATKGLAVAPSRVLDEKDTWTTAFIGLSEHARQIGKQVAMHTHFNHPNEITWVTYEAAKKLWAAGVTVRNQSVLLKGVNDNLATMSKLIRLLSDLNIQPYYVYQHDLVPHLEDLRTPLSTILTLEKQIRGTIAGFMTPNFVVDLPGGGGKRLATSYETYDPESGLSTFIAPGVKGGEKVYQYWDPVTEGVKV